ncbi:hypothetical protein [Novosphingobium sp. 28-62-57]|uniref:hypothetical protein n=1 Tax=Novosphingobium sp. 28-62-57 TaxID=1970409 RepID=UPI0025FD7FC0|nr:hypothetical protein [Novosphingobium sp. 28-62-57]
MTDTTSHVDATSARAEAETRLSAPSEDAAGTTSMLEGHPRYGPGLSAPPGYLAAPPATLSRIKGNWIIKDVARIDPIYPSEVRMDDARALIGKVVLIDQSSISVVKGRDNNRVVDFACVNADYGVWPQEKPGDDSTRYLEIMLSKLEEKSRFGGGFSNVVFVDCLDLTMGVEESAEFDQHSIFAIVSVENEQAYLVYSNGLVLRAQRQ